MEFPGLRIALAPVMDILDHLHRINPANPGLNHRLAEYLHCFTTEDYQGILLLTYPGIYRFVSKSLMMEKVAAMFREEGMVMSMDLFEIDQVGQVIEAPEGLFARVDYRVLVSLRFPEHAVLSLPERLEKKEFFLKSFQAAMGKENIWYEDHTESYCFYKQNSMVAIEDSQSPQWTFLTLQAGPWLDALLPESVRIILQSRE